MGSAARSCSSPPQHQRTGVCGRSDPEVVLKGGDELRKVQRRRRDWDAHRRQGLAGDAAIVPEHTPARGQVLRAFLIESLLAEYMAGRSRKCHARDQPSLRLTSSRPCCCCAEKLDRPRKW